MSRRRRERICRAYQLREFFEQEPPERLIDGLTSSQRHAIPGLRRAGWKVLELAHFYKVTPGTIWRVLAKAEERLVQEEAPSLP